MAAWLHVAVAPSKEDAMKVIVLASQKGGSGKTTLAAHLAVAAVQAGQRAALIDTDPQHSLTTWAEKREAEEPPLIETPDLRGAIGHLQAEGYDLVLIDTPPTVTPNITRTIRLASLVVIPVRPSPLDVWAAGETVGVCQAQGIPFCFAVNQAIRNAGATTRTMGELSRHGVVSPSVIYTRIAFSDAMTAGLTAAELDPRNQGAQEIADLLAFMASQCQGATQASQRNAKQVRAVGV
jgi:chromosome partitioning protein